MTIRGERGNVPEKGFAAEIQILVSAGFGLVPGRICLGLSQYVECYRRYYGFTLPRSVSAAISLLLKGEGK